MHSSCPPTGGLLVYAQIRKSLTNLLISVNVIVPATVITGLPAALFTSCSSSPGTITVYVSSYLSVNASV